MGFCPFLKYILIDKFHMPQLPVTTVHHEDVMGTGMTDHEYAVTEIGAVGGYDISLVYVNGNTPSIDPFIQFVQCPQSSACQQWDTHNSRCGLKTADLINNPVDTTPQALFQLLKAVLGNYGDIASGNSFVEEIQAVFGKVGDITPAHTFLEEFQDILIKRGDIASGKTLAVELQEVWGKRGDIASGKTALVEVQEVAGKRGDIASGKTAIVEFQEVFGARGDIESGNTMLEENQYVIGTKAQVDAHYTKDNFLKFEQVEHDVLLHEHDEHLHPYSHKCHTDRFLNMDNGGHEGAPIMTTESSEAPLLVTEYMVHKDLDNNGKIYGFDFWIDPDDPVKPLVLLDLEDDNNWVEPSLKWTWQEYLDSLPD